VDIEEGVERKLEHDFIYEGLNVKIPRVLRYNAIFFFSRLGFIIAISLLRHYP